MHWKIMSDFSCVLCFYLSVCVTEKEKHLTSEFRSDQAPCEDEATPALSAYTDLIFMFMVLS